MKVEVIGDTRKCPFCGELPEAMIMATQGAYSPCVEIQVYCRTDNCESRYGAAMMIVRGGHMRYTWKHFEELRDQAFKEWNAIVEVVTGALAYFEANEFEKLEANRIAAWMGAVDTWRKNNVKSSKRS